MFKQKVDVRLAAVSQPNPVQQIGLVCLHRLVDEGTFLWGQAVQVEQAAQFGRQIFFQVTAGDFQTAEAVAEEAVVGDFARSWPRL